MKVARAKKLSKSPSLIPVDGVAAKSSKSSAPATSRPLHPLDNLTGSFDDFDAYIGGAKALLADMPLHQRTPDVKRVARLVDGALSLGSDLASFATNGVRVSVNVVQAQLAAATVLAGTSPDLADALTLIVSGRLALQRVPNAMAAVRRMGAV